MTNRAGTVIQWNSKNLPTPQGRYLFSGNRIDKVHWIQAAVQTGTPLGNERCKEQIEPRLKQRVGYAKQGRPRKLNHSKRVLTLGTGVLVLVDFLYASNRIRSPANQSETAASARA